MRTFGVNGAGKAIPASGTVVFSSNDMPGDNVVAFYVSMVGAGSSVSTTGLKRIRLKAGGELIWDLDALCHRSFIESFGTGRWAPSSSESAGSTQIVIPLNMIDAPTFDRQDTSGFPMGRSPTLELDFGTDGDGTGSVFVGWAQSSVVPTFFPKVTQSSMGIAASVSNGRYKVTNDGILRSFGIPATGLARLRSTFNGRQYQDVYGPGVATIADVLYPHQRIDGISSANYPGCVWMRGGWAIPLNQGGASFLELDTGATWAGDANVCATYTLHPQR